MSTRTSRVFQDGGYWPYLLATLLFSGVAMNVGMVIAAGDDPSFSIEPDYYQKAVNWDLEREQLRRNQELGWSIKTHARIIGRELRLEVDLRDGSGHRLSDAQVRVSGFHVARATQRHRSTMRLVGPTFKARFETQNSGLWEFLFSAQLGDKTFTHTARIDVSRMSAEAR